MNWESRFLALSIAMIVNSGVLLAVHRSMADWTLRQTVAVQAPERIVVTQGKAQATTPRLVADGSCTTPGTI